MQPLPPKIGRYVVEELVGVGGMGQIYKARDPDLLRTVAIKLISTELMRGADRADYIRRFRREAEAAARCSHPNIVAVYEFALHEDQPYLSMEFVSGCSLRELLDDAGAMDVPDAIAIMVQVLDALSSAHGQGVIHQDIKPSNIMLTAEHRVKVGDFGISRIMTVETMTITSAVGTPPYMSPEQCRGDPVDARSDLFSAGATLFEMVSGDRPFKGRSATEVSHRIQNDSLPLLPAHVRNAAPRLQLVLERAMGKDPADRFETAADFAKALRQMMKEDAPDRTRVAPKSSRSSFEADPIAPPEEIDVRKPGMSIDPEVLAAVEDKLKVYVGPIARVLVQHVARRCRSAAQFSSELELSVPEGGDRERFRRELASLLWLRSSTFQGRTSMGRSSSRGNIRLPEHELERAQAALAQFTGPIAPILVRRAAASVTSVEDLWQALSNHIPSPPERSAFLRRLKT